MRFLTRFSLRNPVAIAIFVLLIVVSGILSALGLQEDLMPNLSIPVISISTTYPGASPSQVATDVTTPIEKALNGAANVDSITSSSMANVSQIELQLNMNANLNTVEQNVQQIVNQVSLPSTAGQPQVKSFSFSNTPVLAITVASNKLSSSQLKSVVNQTVVPGLQGVAGVATVSAAGASPDNVVLQFHPSGLTKYNLSVQQVLADLQGDNLTVPLGTATAGGKVQPVQLNSAPTSIGDIRNLRIPLPINPTAGIQKAVTHSLTQVGQSVGQVAKGLGQVGQSVGMVQAETTLLAKLQQIQGQIFGAEMTLNTELSVPSSRQNPEAIAKLKGEIQALQSAQVQLQNQLMSIMKKLAVAEGSRGQGGFVSSGATGGAPSAAFANSGGTASTLSSIPLSDVASVNLEPPADSSINRTDGQPSILITITQTENANTVTVVKGLKKELSLMGSSLPAGVHIHTLFDASTMITASVNGMVREAVLGAVFAVLVILFFLRNALTTLVAVVSIPISILTAMILLSRYGVTLNIMTLGGLAVATGRVVDDSIVVIENIYRTWKNGLGFGKKLVMYATAEVGSAILSSTLATIAVFAPLTLVGGIVGKIFMPFALTVVCALASSLLVALTVVPMLAWLFVVRKPLPGAPYDALMGEGDVEAAATLASVSKKPAAWQRGYQRVLSWCLDHKFLVILGTAIVFVASLGLIPLVGSTFIQNTMQNTATISVTMPVGTPLSTTDAKARQVERVLKRDSSYISQVNTSVGGGTGFRSSAPSTNVATIDVELHTNANVNQFLALARSQTQGLAAKGTTISVKGQMTGGGGTSFDIVLTGSNTSSMDGAATRIQNALSNFHGLANVQTNLSQTQPQVTITPKNEQMAKYGLTAQQLAGEVRNYVSLQNIGTVNLGGQTYNLEATISSSSGINSVSAIREIPVSTGTGLTIPLSDVASVDSVQTPTSILHSDGQPYVEITADYTTQNTNRTLRNAMKTIKALNLPSSVHVAQSSSVLQQNQSFTQLIEAILVAIGMVYIVMLILFGGWAAPFAILFSMPVALIGAFVGTFIAHEPLSVSSLIGILMLMGIVVTNAIVLVQRVEQQRERGLGVRAALLEAGSTRLRPIVMTAVATICALLPLAVGASDGVLISQGLAVVVIGGLVTSTILTLCIVPLMYELLHRRQKLREERAM